MLKLPNLANDVQAIGRNVSERGNTVSLPQHIEPDARLKAAKLAKTRILQNPTTISLKSSGLLTLPGRSIK